MHTECAKDFKETLHISNKFNSINKKLNDCLPAINKLNTLFPIEYLQFDCIVAMHFYLLHMLLVNAIVARLLTIHSTPNICADSQEMSVLTPSEGCAMSQLDSGCMSAKFGLQSF